MIILCLFLSAIIVFLYTTYLRMHPIVYIPLEGNPNLIVYFRINLNKRSVRVINIKKLKGKVTKADLGAITEEQVGLTMLRLYKKLVNEYVRK